jgi:hypothetical protein
VDEDRGDRHPVVIDDVDAELFREVFIDLTRHLRGGQLVFFGRAGADSGNLIRRRYCLVGAAAQRSPAADRWSIGA